MIRLTFVSEGSSASLEEPSLYYRVTGGLVWTRPEPGPVAIFFEDEWRYGDRLWAGMRFEGDCRLILGLPRDPVAVSEPLRSVSVAGRRLSANGLPIAVYDPAREFWFGVDAGVFWPAFRIESTELRQQVSPR
jgi:hypothetical protein